MTDWRKRIRLVPLLQREDLSDVQKMQRTRRLLERHEEFADVLPDIDAAIAEADVDAFDDCLEQVYDIADAELIWMGI